MDLFIDSFCKAARSKDFDKISEILSEGNHHLWFETWSGRKNYDFENCPVMELFRTNDVSFVKKLMDCGLLDMKKVPLETIDFEDMSEEFHLFLKEHLKIK
jgi:hypothetical protein